MQYGISVAAQKKEDLHLFFILKIICKTNVDHFLTPPWLVVGASQLKAGSEFSGLEFQAGRMARGARFSWRSSSRFLSAAHRCLCSPSSRSSQLLRGAVLTVATGRNAGQRERPWRELGMNPKLCDVGQVT